MNVFLVHGLGRTPLSLVLLANALRRAGCRTHFFGYSPTFEPLPRITRRLAVRLGELTGPVGLVGHSLGGLLLRMAIPQVPTLQVLNLVMLGSPNRPPRLARSAWRHGPFRWLTRECGAFLASPDAVLRLPVPAVPYTLIAGTAGPRGAYSPFGDDPNDGVVAVDETRIRDEDDPERFPVWHTVMMNDRRVQEAVVFALTAERPTPVRGSRPGV